MDQRLRLISDRLVSSLKSSCLLPPVENAFGAVEEMSDAATGVERRNHHSNSAARRKRYRLTTRPGPIYGEPQVSSDVPK